MCFSPWNHEATKPEKHKQYMNNSENTYCNDYSVLYSSAMIMNL